MKLDFCVACGTKEELHFHHLVPRSIGGTEDPRNILTLCNVCHGIMHSQKAMSKSELTKIGQAKARAFGKIFGKPRTIQINLTVPTLSRCDLYQNPDGPGPAGVLSLEQKKQILERFLQGGTYYGIGKEFGVNHNQVARIVKRAAGVRMVQ